MDCDELQRRVANRVALGDPEAQSHLAECPACWAMTQVAGSLPRRSNEPGQGAGQGAAQAVGEQAWRSLAAAMAADERPVARMRSWSTGRRLAVGLAVAVAVPLLVLLVSTRVDLPHVPMLRWFVELAALVTIVVAGSTLALRPLQRHREPAWVAWVGLIGAAVTIVLAMLPAAHHDHPASLMGAGDDVWRKAAGCLAFGTLCAVPTWLGLRMLARDGDRLGANAGFVAAVAAAVAAAAVMVHCPIVHRTHLLLGHASVLLLPWIWALLVSRRSAPSRAR